MKILITGANGFLGKNLVAYLRDNTDHELITPLKEDGTDKRWIAARNVDSFCLNLLDTWTLNNVCKNAKPDAIIHLAGVVGGIGFNINNQGKLLNDNLQIGMNVLNAAKNNEIKKVIMLGTTCSYPCVPKTIPFIEDELFDGMPEITNSGYGIAKRTLVKMGMEYASQYGLQVVNLIPTNMIGEHDHFDEHKSHVVPALIKKFEQAKLNYDLDLKDEDGNEYDHFVRLWGTGSASRDFLYVGDCVKAIAVALTQDVGPEPINLGAGKEITIKELAETIKKVGGYDAEIVWDPSRPNGQPRRCLDVSRAKYVLRWEAKTSLEQALKRTIEWYRNNK